MMRRATFFAGNRLAAFTITASRRCIHGERNEGDIMKLVKERGVFSDNSVESAVRKLMSRLSESSYALHYTDEEIASHVHGFLCAKAKNAIGETFEHFHESEESAFYICRKDHSNQLRAVRQLTNFVTRKRETKQSVSVRCYTDDNGDICVFTAKIRPFVNPNPEKDETNISQLTSEAFLEERSPEILERYQDLITRYHDSVVPVHSICEVDGELCFSMIMAADRSYYIATLHTVIQEIPGAVVARCFSETFSNDTHVYTFYVRGATAQQLNDRTSMVTFLPSRPNNLITRLHEEMVFNTEETVYTDAAVIFAFYFTPQPTSDDYRHLRTIVAKEPNGVSRLNSLRTALSLEMMSERYILTLISLYPNFMKEIYEDFRRGSTPEFRGEICSRITSRLKEDQRSEHDLCIFKAFLKFNEVIVKHNFFKEDKVALCFRLDPSFLRALEYPRVPHGVFLLAGAQWRGFHVRFTDIARGGVRMIISKENMYRRNKRSVFQENYNLAYTQLLKNKDIPEGGSKGTILVSSRYMNKFNQPLCQRIFLQYADALLDVIIPGEKGVIDRLQKPEIIFLGPDENTAGTFPSVGSLFSKKRGYSAWKSFTTGKDPLLGGIPHDTYGMTTRSVRTMARGVYEKLSLDEGSQTKFQTGGPDGDLGSNEILLSKEKTVAILDISASVHDPEGLDKEELVRLAKGRKQLRHFDKTKLSSKGFIVLTEDKNVTLPDGTHVGDGAVFRDEFHLTKYSAADVFVPCGGRPRSVTLANVGRFLGLNAADNDVLLAGGSIQLKEPKYKVIVEGANLFISQDARLAIERCGIVLIKDASSNKGGVTSSSLEVYAGLALSDAEHAQHMCVKDNNVPEFYRDYVQDIIDRIEGNARREFEAIWREQSLQEGMPKTLIADALSEKNVRVRANILSSDMCENKELVRYVLKMYTPKTLLDLVPLDTLTERVPLLYQKAICAMWLASEYVYGSGISGNEFDFFTFMTKHMEQAKALASSSQ